MGTVFRFKQFAVDQRDCAMKINTDGVLLGAVAGIDPEPNRILDIGSGTGVIALMLAQRFATARVDAVEIDEEAFLRSKYNFEQSPFAERLTAYFDSFEKLQPDYRYDLIVSNPPFYTNSLHNPDTKKKLARHTDLAFFERLLYFCDLKLEAEGALQLILPVDLATDVIRIAEETTGFYLTKQINVASFLHTDPFRCIIELRKQKVVAVEKDEFVIYADKGEYTSRYKSVLSPFFLAY